MIPQEEIKKRLHEELTASGKSQTEMMPFLLSLMQGNQGGAQFSASEADLIISAIKAGKSKQEAAKIDQMVRLFRSAASGKKR